MFEVDVALSMTSRSPILEKCQCLLIKSVRQHCLAEPVVAWDDLRHDRPSNDTIPPFFYDPIHAKTIKPICAQAYEFYLSGPLEQFLYCFKYIYADI